MRRIWVRTSSILTLAALALAALARPGLGQVRAASENDTALAMDSRVRVGKLPSGLTYYIMRHPAPAGRGNFWLVVNAGSVLEDADQRGLAHLVEHMAFQGTRRFPKHQLTDFLQGIGVQFGPDLNAHTSFDETIYQLQVPTDRPTYVGKTLQILRDWASEVRFDPEALDNERRVLLEEWRLGRGADSRLRERQAAVLYRGSLYAERSPIGLPAIIQSAPREALLRFYHDWYRPDLMAVVAVGDFSVAEVEAALLREFSDLRPPAAPRPRPQPSLPRPEQPLVSIETDPELAPTQVRIIDWKPRRIERTVGDYQRALAERLYHSMLSDRLDELLRQPGGPLLTASSSLQRPIRPIDEWQRAATVREGGVERGLQALQQEVQRIRIYGFHAGELARAKAELQRELRFAVLRRHKRYGIQFCHQLAASFLEQEVMLSAEDERALAERLLPTITLSELNQLVRSWDGAVGRVILVSGPASLVKPRPESLVAAVHKADLQALPDYQDPFYEVPLLARQPRPGQVIAEAEQPEQNVTEWTLSNGAHVVLKQTDFTSGEIRLVAIGPGGHSLAEDADLDSARFADQVVHASGLGDFDAVALRKLLAGNTSSIEPAIEEDGQFLYGRTQPADLETLMQLFYLGFTAPRRDPEAFLAWRERARERLRRRQLDPDERFFDAVQGLLAQGRPRLQPLTPASVDRVDLDRALAFYRQRFANAANFTFLLVGNLDLDRLQPLCERYLASLPSTSAHEQSRAVGARLPPGIVKRTFALGQEDKSQSLYLFHGLQPWSEAAEHELDTLREVLQLRLHDLLRETLGGVYSVAVSARLVRRRSEYVLSIEFGCAPDKVDALQRALWAELAAIRAHGLGEPYLSRVVQLRRRAHELALRGNGFWQNRLVTAVKFGDSLPPTPDIEPWLGKIARPRLQAAAAHYLDPRQYVLAVMVPAGRTAGPAPAQARTGP